MQSSAIKHSFLSLQFPAKALSQRAPKVRVNINASVKFIVFVSKLVFLFILPFLIKLVSFCAGHIDAHAISDIVFHIGGFKIYHDSEEMHVD